MTENKYTSTRIIDGKPRIVIVDETGKIVNRSPSKDELKGITRFPEKDGRSYPKRIEPYNLTNTCPVIKEDGNICGKILAPAKATREHNKEGRYTGRWICMNCWQKYDPDSHNNKKKAVANIRTGNLNPNHANTIGAKVQKLINTLKIFEDLNNKFNNYKTPVDSIDPITGLTHQIRGKFYDHVIGRWDITLLQRDWNKKFHSMFVCCISKDGKVIERIYEFPKSEIESRINIKIYNNNNYHWYNTYRMNEEEIKKANNIWKEITL